MIRLLLLAALILIAAPSLHAQTLTAVWDTTFVGASAVGVSQDGAVVAVGRSSSFSANRAAAIRFHDAATGARIGGFETGENGGAFFRTPSVLAFDRTGASVYTAGTTSNCGANTCTSYSDIVRIGVADGAERFSSEIDNRLATVTTSGDYLTYTRDFSSILGVDVDFAVFEDGPDSLALVFAGEDEFGNPSSLNNTFSPDGTRLVAIRYDRGDYVVDIRRVGTWEVEHTIPVPEISYDRPVSAVLSPDNASLAISVSPTAGSDPGGLYLFRVSDGERLYYRSYAADSPDEVRFSALLSFVADGTHIAGVESGFTGSMRTEWVSVFRASDGVRVASMRIGDPHVYNDRGPLGIRPVPGAMAAPSRFAVLAYKYAGVVEVQTAPRPVAAADAPAAGLTLGVAPNPATTTATVRLGVTEAQTVRVEVFDALGRRVAVLFDGLVAGGAEQVLPLGTLPAGVYLVRATSGTQRVSQRVVMAPR